MSAAKKYPISSPVATPVKSGPSLVPATPAPSGDDSTIYKKISPYPFAVQLVRAEGQPSLEGHIVKLTDLGFLMRVDKPNFYRISENYQLSFVLPVMESTIGCQGKVVKTYDGKKQYLVEIHFIELPSSSKTSINNYLVKSGQKKF